MDSQKLENILNLALDSAQEEREKTLDLDTGYNEEDNRWELIVKYNGDLSRLDSTVIRIEELIAGYAIVTIPQNLIDSFVELEEIEYVEKPKRLYFSLARERGILYSAGNGKRALFKWAGNDSGSDRFRD